MKIGVLAVQGAFREHQKIFEQLGADAVQVKQMKDLRGVDGLAIPGGESTAIGKLIREYSLVEPIQELAKKGMPVMGTCAGLIVLANRISGGEASHLGLLNVEVNRNSFGRQKESFETDLEIPSIGTPAFPAVFIRAPHVKDIGENVEVLARYEERVVGVRQDNLLGFSFHPELTGDSRLHEYFLGMVENASAKLRG